MIHISAPYPQILTTSIFPNPELQDTETLTIGVQLHRSMNGKRYTYTKKPGTRIYKLSFVMTRLKGLELVEFWRSYAASDWRINLHDGRILVGKVTTNPIELGNFRRAPYAVGTSQESQEICDVEFEVQGKITTLDTSLEQILVPVEEIEGDDSFSIQGPSTGNGAITIHWSNAPSDTTSLRLDVSFTPGGGSDVVSPTVATNGDIIYNLLANKLYFFTLTATTPGGDVITNELEINSGGV